MLVVVPIPSLVVLVLKKNFAAEYKRKQKQNDNSKCLWKYLQRRGRVPQLNYIDADYISQHFNFNK